MSKRETRSLPLSGRELARQVLLRVRKDGAYTNLALSAALQRARGLKREERHLATELVYGVLRRQRQLDEALQPFARKPINGLHHEVLDALRLAAYQILFLDRIPAYAAVDDAVAAIRRARGKAMAGFANAVLRKVQPGQDAGASAGALAVRCSVPDPLAKLWLDQLGPEQAEALGRHLLSRAPLVGRVNRLKTDPDALEQRLAQEGAHAQKRSWARDAVQLVGLEDPFASPSFLEGWWTTQDEGAQLAAELLQPQPGQSVLDLCAGVGGKSTHLAALMQNQGEVVCVDTSRRKLALLSEHCLRLGVTVCRPLVADARHLSSLGERRFSRVLLDAPCSGLGVLRRHPELKWRLDWGALGRLASLQKDLLRAAASWLAPGGTLVYCVCTTTEEEGPAQVAWVKQSLRQLELWPDTDDPWPRLADKGAYRLWPHRHDTDGFFLARFRRCS